MSGIENWINTNIVFGQLISRQLKNEDLQVSIILAHVCHIY